MIVSRFCSSSTSALASVCCIRCRLDSPPSNLLSLPPITRPAVALSLCMQAAHTHLGVAGMRLPLFLLDNLVSHNPHPHCTRQARRQACPDAGEGNTRRLEAWAGRRREERGGQAPSGHRATPDTTLSASVSASVFVRVCVSLCPRLGLSVWRGVGGGDGNLFLLFG